MTPETCPTGKVPHASAADASRVLHRGLTVYRCPFGDHWHLTHLRRARSRTTRGRILPNRVLISTVLGEPLYF
jgi:hypothetical protein